MKIMNPLLLFIAFVTTSFISIAQSPSISRIVIDENNEALALANVLSWDTTGFIMNHVNDIYYEGNLLIKNQDSLLTKKTNTFA